jgi:hypothetical protein
MWTIHMDLNDGQSKIGSDFLFEVTLLYRVANCNEDIINSYSLRNKHKLPEQIWTLLPKTE